VVDYRSEPALLEFLPEALDLFRVESTELPASRIPREDLKSITLLRYGCVYRVVEGLGDGDVNPDLDRRLSLFTGSLLPGR
jgi:hypothetical protein